MKKIITTKGYKVELENGVTRYYPSIDEGYGRCYKDADAFNADNNSICFISETLFDDFDGKGYVSSKDIESNEDYKELALTRAGMVQMVKDFFDGVNRDAPRYEEFINFVVNDVFSTCSLCFATALETIDYSLIISFYEVRVK